MSLLQKVGCCSCSVPELPCNNCNTDRCTCGPSEAQPQTVPVTSVHIEISEMSTSRFSADIEDSSAWHYRANKSWRNTEMGVKFNRLMSKIGSLVLRANFYAEGYRIGDHMPVSQITSRLYPLTIPAGRWGNYPRQGENTLKTVCGPCGDKSGGFTPCGDDAVVCCRCNEQGSAHDCFAVSTYDCLASQGTVLGPYDGGPLSPSCSTCTDSCNGWNSGLVGVVQRSYNLVKDAFFRGGGNLFRAAFSKKISVQKDKNVSAQLHKRRLLVQTSTETSDDPQIFTEEQTLIVAKGEGQLERTESRVRIPITTTVEHEGEILELSGGMGTGIGGGGPGGGGGGGDEFDCENVPCITGTACGPGCRCVAGRCLPIPQPVTCQQHCGGINDCTQRGEWWEKYGKDIDQSKDGVWNYISSSMDCCNASYAGTSITVEMDWPCEETANAYIKARQKYDFGQAAFKEAQRYCAENPGDAECGQAGNTVKPECCNTLAQELIGAMPPTTIPCIKHCPLQPTCDDDYVRWPQGDKQPFGDNVEQSISCMGGVKVEGTFDPEEDYTPSIEGPDDVSPAILTPTGSSPCQFLTNPVNRNWAAYCNGGHQCGEGSYCGPQFCCHEADCYNSNCCEQILDYNPNTGEPVTDEERLYLGPDKELCPYGLADDGNGNIGGWSAIPDADGVYHRCKRPLADCEFAVGDQTVTEKGCEYQPAPERDCASNCPQGQNVPPCCSGGDFCSPSGDVISWMIPRKRPGGGPQGIYSRHCPDTIEPFTPNGPSKYINPNCRREIAPIPGDPGYCQWDRTNPVGTLCVGGLCRYLNSPRGENGEGNWGDPFHMWLNQPLPDGLTGICGDDFWKPCVKKPTGYSDICTPNQWETDDDRNHDPSACGESPCDDIVTPGGKTCVRCQCKGQGRSVINGMNQPCNVRPCGGVGCREATMGKWIDGYYSEEMGLQLVSVHCSPLPTKSFERTTTYIAGECDNFEERQQLGFEKAFQISLEYKGGGTSYDYGSGTVGRQGQGTFTLIKDYNAPDDCIFGSYNDLLDGAWSTGGGAGPAPYWDRNNPGNGFYYKNGLNYNSENEPECDKDIWKRAGASPSCKWSNPRAVIL